jgi:hypothetical protein
MARNRALKDAGENGELAVTESVEKAIEPIVRKAPGPDEVAAYWASGRTLEEAQIMRAAHTARCVALTSGEGLAGTEETGEIRCDVMVEFLPQPGDDDKTVYHVCAAHHALAREPEVE